jgi:hypothetical protein
MDFFEDPPEMFYAELADLWGYADDHQNDAHFQPAADALQDQDDISHSTDDFTRRLLPLSIGDDLDTRLNPATQNICSVVPAENGLADYLRKAADIETMEEPLMAVRTSLPKEPRCPADFL